MLINRHDPKTIHYCWFGGNPLTDDAERSIASWVKYAPGFAIVRWDEHNFDTSCSSWTRAAYDAGKYAFVSDYVRFRILYEYGGVYMDVGSELVKDICAIVAAKTPFSAIEGFTLTATTGLIVSVKPHDGIIGAVLKTYDELSFEDDPDFLAAHTVNSIFTKELKKLGFVEEDRLQTFGGWTVFPSEAFDPVYGFGGYHIKEGTYGVHRSSASWLEPKFKLKQEFQGRWTPLLGRRLAQVFGRIIGEIKHEGLRDGIKNLASVALDVAKRKADR